MGAAAKNYAGVDKANEAPGRIYVLVDRRFSSCTIEYNHPRKLHYKKKYFYPNLHKTMLFIHKTSLQFGKDNYS